MKKIEGPIYLDNNATTRIAPEVLGAMAPYLDELYFNPSSRYSAAVAVSHALNEARAQIANHLGTTVPEEIVFTSCATESNNTAFRGAIKANPGRRHIVTSAVEHPAVMRICEELESSGYTVTRIPVDAMGRIDESILKDSIGKGTLLVSIMHANNETGVLFPIEKLSAIVKERDPEIIFHTDATQSVGKLGIVMSDEYRNVDILSFSGHKIHAPKGIGCLYIRSGTCWKPFLLGGHQENGLRAGTENTASIVGLAKALDIAAEGLKHDEVMKKRRDDFERIITEKIPDVLINGKNAPRLSNTTSISIYGIEGDNLVSLLDQKRVLCSTGAACSSMVTQDSHVLESMGVPQGARSGTIRISQSRYTTDMEIEELLSILPGIVSRLRSMSL